MMRWPTARVMRMPMSSCPAANRADGSCDRPAWSGCSSACRPPRWRSRSRSRCTITPRPAGSIPAARGGQPAGVPHAPDDQCGAAPARRRGRGRHGGDYRRCPARRRPGAVHGVRRHHRGDAGNVYDLIGSDCTTADPRPDEVWATGLTGADGTADLAWHAWTGAVSGPVLDGPGPITRQPSAGPARAVRPGQGSAVSGWPGAVRCSIARSPGPVTLAATRRAPTGAGPPGLSG